MGILPDMKLKKKEKTQDNPENPTLSPIAPKEEPPTPSPEQADLETRSSTSSPDRNEVSHFDHLIEETEQSEQEASKITFASTRLSQDQFRQSFVGLHNAGSAFTGIKAVALPNGYINEATANEVADTLYETILDIPMLHFLLEPSNKWFGRAMVMTVYVAGMNNAIKSEIGEKQQPSKRTANQPEQKRREGEVSPEQAAALTGGA